MFYKYNSTTSIHLSLSHYLLMPVYCLSFALNVILIYFILIDLLIIFTNQKEKRKTAVPLDDTHQFKIKILFQSDQFILMHFSIICQMLHDTCLLELAYFCKHYGYATGLRVLFLTQGSRSKNPGWHTCWTWWIFSTVNRKWEVNTIVDTEPYLLFQVDQCPVIGSDGYIPSLPGA